MSGYRRQFNGFTGLAMMSFLMWFPLHQPSAEPFTYQGQITNSNVPINGPCDIRFRLFGSAEGNDQIGMTQTVLAEVQNSLFTISALDFGPGVFNGEPRWLEIAVRQPAGSGSFVTLSPRQPITHTPYASYAADGPYTAGAGLTLMDHQFAVAFDGSGTSPTVAHSDHDHWGQTWEGQDNGLILISDSAVSNAAVIIARSNIGTGVQGLAAPPNSSAGMIVPTAVSGINLLPAGGFSNRAYGVFGQANGPDSFGVYGASSNQGVSGYSDGNNGIGVYGEAVGSGSTGVRGNGPSGMYATSTISNGNGAIASADAGTLAFGVWGISAEGYAGYFSGKVNVTGNLTKGGGAFRIDHPLDPANKYLSHSFVESPDMKNIYDGVAVLDELGEAGIQLPEWFQTLNRDFRYQLTCIGGYAPVYIAEEVANNQFRIAGGPPGMKVSWQVTGIRQDPWANDHRIQVEEPKPAEEAGTYLYPEGYGQPSSASLDRAIHRIKADRQKSTTSKPQSSHDPSGSTWIRVK